MNAGYAGYDSTADLGPNELLQEQIYRAVARHVGCTVAPGQPVDAAPAWLDAWYAAGFPDHGRFVVGSDDSWATVPWNPIRREDDPRPDMPDRPTWTEVFSAHRRNAREAFDAEVARAVRALASECTRRITAAYGADSWEDEIQLRLRGAHTAQQDALRDTLRAAYARCRDWLRRPDLTGAELSAFDPAADAHWRDTV